MGMESNDSQNTCLIEETSALMYDSSASARRKRREIRFFKKFSCTPASSIRGLNLVHQGILKRTSSRPSSTCSSLYLLDGGTQEGANCFPGLISEQGFSHLVQSGLARSRSYPPEGWHTSKYVLQISKIGCPSVANGVEKFTTVVRDDHYQILDTSSCAAEPVHAADQEGPYANQLQKADVPAQNVVSLCITADPANLSNVECMNKVSEVNVNSLADQAQAAINIASEGHMDGVNFAEKTALLCNEKRISTPIEQISLQLNQASSRIHPPSGKLCIIGRRREMEDTAVLVPSFAQIPSVSIMDGPMEAEMTDLHFYGVYDGHGGSQASNYCAERLHHALAEEIARCSLTLDSSNSKEWESVMSSCFMKVDKEVGGVCPYGACDDVDSSAGCCQSSIAPENVGTTAVVAVVNSTQIILANCGDSRAVLSRGGRVMPLSLDHKPERVDETNRIEAAGGRVIAWKGYRVGALLAVSRALGDRYLKRYVISQPDVTCLQRTEEDEFLILASDGLWDVIDNETACDVARKWFATAHSNRERQTSRGDDFASSTVAAILVKMAFGKGSQDNITVVVIDLRCRR